MPLPIYNFLFSLHCGTQYLCPYTIQILISLLKFQLGLVTKYPSNLTIFDLSLPIHSVHFDPQTGLTSFFPISEPPWLKPDTLPALVLVIQQLLQIYSKSLQTTRQSY